MAVPPVPEPGEFSKPASKSVVQEALHLRHTMVGVWRSGLDEDIAGYEAELAEMASYRSSCRQAAQQRGRDRASRWREERDRSKDIRDLSRILQSEGALAGGPVPGHEGGSLGPTPAEGPSAEHAIGLAGGCRGSVPMGDLIERESLVLQAGRLAKGQQARSARVAPTGALLDSSLRPKQPLQARLLKVRQRGQQRRREAIIEDAASDEPKYPSGPVPTKPGQSHKVLGPGGASMNADKAPTSKTWELFAKVKHTYRPEFLKVFQIYDVNGNNKLDQSELLSCLSDVGLRGTNTREREAIQQILDSTTGGSGKEVTFDCFIDEVVPAVRGRLAELKKDKFRTLWNEADADGTGLLSINEMLQIMRLMGVFPMDSQVLEAIVDLAPDVEHKCKTMEGTWIRNRDALDFDRFCAVVPLLQERAARTEWLKVREVAETMGLNEAQRDEWEDHLIALSEAFERGFQEHEVGKLFRDLGLAPRFAIGKSDKTSPSELLAEIAGPNGLAAACQGCGALLKLAGKVRRHDRRRLEDIFKKYDLNKSNSLSLLEVQHAFGECKIIPRTQREAEEMHAAVADFDEDGSGDVDVDEFVRLCQYVTERMRLIRHEEERQCAAECGYDKQQLEALREAFETLDDDMNEVLDGKEVLRAVEMLRKQCSREDGDLLFLEQGIDMRQAAAGEPVAASFCQFLRMMHSLDLREVEGREEWARKRQALAAQRPAPRSSTGNISGVGSMPRIPGALRRSPVPGAARAT